MTINLLDENGDYNKAAVEARARALHRAAMARRDKGESATLEYWSAYCWRIARQQYETHKKTEVVQAESVENDLEKKISPKEETSL